MNYFKVILKYILKLKLNFKKLKLKKLIIYFGLIYHCVCLTIDYFKFPTYVKTEYKITKTDELSAVSLCVNNDNILKMNDSEFNFKNLYDLFVNLIACKIEGTFNKKFFEFDCIEISDAIISKIDNYTTCVTYFSNIYNNNFSRITFSRNLDNMYVLNINIYGTPALKLFIIISIFYIFLTNK